MVNIGKGVWMTVCEGICSIDWKKQMLNKIARNKIIKKHSLM